MNFKKRCLLENEMPLLSERMGKGNKVSTLDSVLLECSVFSGNRVID